MVRELYDEHKGMFNVDSLPKGVPTALTQDETETVDAVLDFYGDRSSQWLSDLTHQEDPWRDARKGLLPGQRGSQEITLAAMAEYYGSL